MLAPVAMFVYNRADHFKRTYESLAACPEAAQTPLYIFADGAKNPSAEEQVRKVRELLPGIKNDGRFLSVSVAESDVNKGLAASIIQGVTEVLEKHDRVIVLEDDCAPCRYFLGYMNACLDFYEKDSSIGSVSGYSPAIRLPDDYDEDIFLARRSCSWSWGVWKDRWDGLEWEAQKLLSEMCRRPELMKAFGDNGSDRFIRLYRQSKGRAHSWSVCFGANLTLQNRFTVYPRYSYIENIGCDASGVHSKAEDAEKMRVDISRAIEKPRLRTVAPDERIQRIMRKHYSGGPLTELKRKLVSFLILSSSDGK